MPAIVVKDLCKTYGEVTALDHLSFSVADGEICALLGPNGAGKTTTVEILEGHRAATAGAVTVLGFDPWTGGRAYRERIGVVLQDAGFDDEQTVLELVRMYSEFYPRSLDAQGVIELVGLGGKSNARVKTLSGGQKRRLDLALGLVGDPEVLFLDEPTTGFDPAARRHAWELVGALRQMGKTVLLTTHYMDEAQHLADHIVVVSGGTLAWHGTPAELIDRTGSRSTVRFQLPIEADGSDLPDLPGAVRREGADVEVDTADATATLYALTQWAVRHGLSLERLGIERRSLEEAYLELVDGEVNPQ